MKSKSDPDYEDYINYLRNVCFNPHSLPNMNTLRKKIDSGELKTDEEVRKWVEEEEKRLEPIRIDNDIALRGTDEEVIELTKKICPAVLE